MSTSSSFSNPEARQRPGRAVPRRHVEPVESSEGAKYDGVEFPVLLRLPEMLQEDPAAADPPEIRSSLPPEGSSNSDAENAIPMRHGPNWRGGLRWDGPPTHRERLTAAASQQFWLSLAPKIAVGGMLLAVTALCFALLSGSRENDGPTDNPSQWANEPPLHSEESIEAANPHLLHSHARPEKWPSKPNSVAAKPQPLPTAKSDRPGGSSRQAPTLALPPGQTNATFTENPVISWPAETLSPANSPSGGAGAPPLQNTSPVQGWPEEMNQPSNQVREFELDLNASARRPSDGPAMRTSLRATTPVPPVAPPAAAGARLNGTVELPKLGADSRL
jgi:hypothetical protein